MKMLFDIENWKEIIATLGRNKTRTFLTGFGIFWGTAMLAMLWGGGHGLLDLMSSNFKGFATNSCFMAASNTSMPYHGYGKGRAWQIDYSDIDRIRERIHGIKLITPVIFHYNSNVAASTQHSSATVKGVESEYPKVESPIITSGRFLNKSDAMQNRKVCVLGKHVCSNIFGTENSVGKFIKLDDEYYKIVGVVTQTTKIQIGGKMDDCVFIPLSTMQIAYNYGNRIDLLCATMRRGVQPADIKDDTEAVLRTAHDINPKDEQAIMFIDIGAMFKMVNNIFIGIRLLALLVGAGTLMAGIIGVGNIMFVIIKERTQEIGIRRAIGAKPRDIMVQILSESMVMTTAAGLLGLCFAVLILAAVEAITEMNGTPATFQISFNEAVSITFTFIVLGTAAGLLPAWRTMKIKPIEALQDD